MLNNNCKNFDIIITLCTLKMCRLSDYVAGHLLLDWGEVMGGQGGQGRRGGGQAGGEA